MSTNLLIVDDDTELLLLLKEFFTRNGFIVDVASTTFAAMNAFRDKLYDILILDLHLGGDEGSQLCERIRKKSDIPIVMLTSNQNDDTKILCFNAGADDYVTKPCRNDVLLARIHAILARTQHSRSENYIYQFLHWKFDQRHAILIDQDNNEVSLSTGLCDLLLVFVTHPQEKLTRSQIFKIMCGQTYDFDFDRSVDIKICRLRNLLGDNEKTPKFIRTIRGHGYEFLPDVQHIEADKTTSV